MPNTTYLQSSFLGGKLSPFAQGRYDREDYRSCLAQCLNSYPLDVGCWTRRQGIIESPTRGGAYGIVRTFDFLEDLPYTLEFTPGHLRLWAGAEDALTPVQELQVGVSSISTATPAVVLTSLPHSFATGDRVLFQLSAPPGTVPNGVGLLFNREFDIAVVDSQHFALADAITGLSIDGTSIDMTYWTVKVTRIVDFATPYQLADLQLNNGNALRVVQNDDVALILHPAYAPYLLVDTGNQNALGYEELSLTTATFVDGPYLDPPQDGTTLTPSGTSGSINLTASAITSINGGAGFQAGDVGRHIALFSQPPAWVSGSSTSYTIGQNVSYPKQDLNAAYYNCIYSNAPLPIRQPDTHPGVWLPASNAAAWSWAIITAVVSTSEVTATLQPADPLGLLPGGPLLQTTPATIWKLGAYSTTTGWPTGGTFYEGRFWMFSKVLNRLDANMSDNNGLDESTGFQFAPVAIDGTEGDANGISDVLEATQKNSIFFMEGTNAGIVMGTQGGEWQLMASQLNDPITSTSEQAHRVTRYGCADIEPVWCGLSLVFVQRYQRNVYEYMCDVFSGRWLGRNLAQDAQDILLPGVAEIAYTATPQPIIWARTLDGRLCGVTYRRNSPFGTQPPEFAGWHQHTLATGRTLISMRAGPSPGGNTDNLSVVTLDPVTGIYYTGFLAPFFDETATPLSAAFVDGGVVPAAGFMAGGMLTLYGLLTLAGKTVQAWVGGVDAGDCLVSSSGTVTVSLTGLLTQSYIASISGSYGLLGVPVQLAPGTTYTIPAIVGFAFTSRGQMLRTVDQREAKTQLGPALGDLRRAAQITFQLVNSQGLSFGTDFTSSTLWPMNFEREDLTDAVASPLQLFTGTYWDMIEDGYSFDSMPTWQVTRPYPATVTAIEVFTDVSDKNGA